MEQRYHFAVILPNTQLFGGVRRFFELGEIFIKKGHQMSVFTPEGTQPDWFNFSGKVYPLSDLQKIKMDVLFVTEDKFLEPFLSAPATLKIFYHVGPRAKLDKLLKRSDVVVFCNSSNMYAYDLKAYNLKTEKAIGGVHIYSQKEIQQTQQPFHIMCYGRLSRKGKGTALVVKAAEKLHRLGYDVKLLMFDRPLDDAGLTQIQNFTPKVPFEFILNHPVDDNESLFKRADVFVAVEKKGGWCNTAAEAMACGVPVVASKTGTNDFLIDGVTGFKILRHPYFIRKSIQKLIGNTSLQKQLADQAYEKIQEFSWEKLAENILKIVSEKMPKK